MMQELSLSAWNQSLLTIYKSFVKPRLECVDIVMAK